MPLIHESSRTARHVPTRHGGRGTATIGTENTTSALSMPVAVKGSHSTGSLFARPRRGHARTAVRDIPRRSWTSTTGGARAATSHRWSSLTALRSCFARSRCAMSCAQIVIAFAPTSVVPTFNHNCQDRQPVSLDSTRDVAQFGSARRLGRRGRRFESGHPDQDHVNRPVPDIARTSRARICRLRVSRSGNNFHRTMGWIDGLAAVLKVSI
jgi:hypothetical protein